MAKSKGSRVGLLGLIFSSLQANRQHSLKAALLDLLEPIETAGVWCKKRPKAF